MITQQFAVDFAQDWVESWNAHDLNRIMDHYADDFEMSSPFIELMGLGSAGTLKGKDNVREYWGKALTKYCDLHFELIGVFFSVDSICLHYKSVANTLAVEWLKFNVQGKVMCASGHYNSIPSPDSSPSSAME
jgi:hypothetical protein